MTPLDGPHTAAGDMPLFTPAAAPCTAGGRNRRNGLRDRFLRAGRYAVDDAELLQLLLSASHSAADAQSLAKTLLDTFGSPAGFSPRARTGSAPSTDSPRPASAPSRPPRPSASASLGANCRSGSIRHSTTTTRRSNIAARSPDTARSRNSCAVPRYRQQADPQRMPSDRHDHHTPACPREICRRALELHSTAVLLSHNHPSGNVFPVQFRHRDDRAHPESAEDDRCHAARPSDRHRARRAQLQGQGPPLAGPAGANARRNTATM